MTAPEGTSYEAMDQYMLQLLLLILFLKGLPYWVTAPGFGSSSSVNSGFLRVILVSLKKGKRTQQEISDELGKISVRIILPGLIRAGTNDCRRGGDTPCSVCFTGSGF